MREVKFYVCGHCGNLVGLINDGGVPMMCCGEKMELLQANTVDAAKEKHVPVVTCEGNTVTVKVGSTAHPMEEKHYIQWIYIHTNQGGHRKCLTPGAEPQAKFALIDGEEFIAAYEYCNLHGLWMAKGEGKHE